MEIKKSKSANLENRKAIFVQIGLVLILSVMLIAFEWTTTDVTIDISMMSDQVIAEEEIVPITRQEEIQQPPPPAPQVTDILTIVDDDVELNDDLEIFDTEMDDKREFDITINVSMDLEEEERMDTEIFHIVEEMPQFPGGEEALNKYLHSSVRYPAIAQENGISGRVYVQFVINQNGEVTNVTVPRSVDPSLDREAIRVVQAMPKWSPGKQRNKPVRVSYTVPINFVLQ